MLIILCVGKLGSFGFTKGRPERGPEPNMLLECWLKLFLKSSWKKIKNIRSAMSVGLLVVRLKYGLYVVQLSKWFILVLMLNF
jgi:hypothetical protein